LSDDRQRIDKWLWHARIVRTRSAAATLATSGHVRINGVRIGAAAKPVKAGDVVTIALDRRVRVLKVTGFAVRRGSANVAQALYVDLAPPDISDKGDGPPGQSSLGAAREPGAGRPTKRDRRAIDRFTRGNDS